MNSHELQNNHHAIFKDFFSQHGLVFSLPFVINWARDIHINYSWLSIKQKLPLRIYFGIKKKKNKKDFSFGQITYFDTNTKDFISTHCYNYTWYFNWLEEYLNERFSDLLDWFWIEITILSELHRWVWLWFNAIITTLCSVLVNYLSDGKDFDMDLISKIDIYNILNSETVYRKIILDSIWFDLIISPYPSISTKICSIFNWYYPVVWFREDWTNYDNIWNTILFWFRLDDVFPELKEVPCLPFDLSIIYSWKPVIWEQLVNNHKGFSDRWDEQQKSILNAFIWYIWHLNNESKPKFYKDYINEKNTKISQTYSQTMWWISLEILYWLYIALGNSFSDSAYEYFIRALNKILHWNYIIRKNSNEFINFMESFAEQFDKQKIALIPNDSSAIWWTIIFISPLDTYRSQILAINQKRNNDVLWSTLLYSSRDNWLKKDGLVVNQDIDKWIRSKFIDWSSFILFDMNWNQIIWDIQELRNSILWDIIFDLSVNKVYIRGERLTSNDLTTQQSTIDLFLKYYENGWKSIHNKTLPTSSYTKQKNEMSSKIVAPFKSHIYNSLKTNIDIELQWTWSNFDIHINLHGLRIAFIKKAW